ncbi:MAG: hypothetical protein AAB303_06770, partial [Chloroflexota bacterium]
MVKRTGPVHVASIKSNHSGRFQETHLLRRTYREGGKVKHQTMGNLSHLPPPVIALVKGALSGQVYVPVSEAIQVVGNLPHGHVAAVLGTAHKLGMPLVVSRVLDPCLDTRVDLSGT